MSSLPELMNPAQVCKTLGITPSGVKRLTQEGYLEVKDMVGFKNGDMSLFRLKQVHGLLPVMPRIKQAWETHDKSRYGARRVSKAHVHRHKSYNIELLPPIEAGDSRFPLETPFNWVQFEPGFLTLYTNGRTESIGLYEQAWPENPSSEGKQGRHIIAPGLIRSQSSGYDHAL